MLLGVGLPTRELSACQKPPVHSSSCRVEAHEVLLSACWSIQKRDVCQVLCRSPQLWVHKCHGPVMSRNWDTELKTTRVHLNVIIISLFLSLPFSLSPIPNLFFPLLSSLLLLHIFLLPLPSFSSPFFLACLFAQYNYRCWRQWSFFKNGSVKAFQCFLNMYLIECIYITLKIKRRPVQWLSG